MLKMWNVSDINECSSGTDNCHVNATCTNTEGAFTCTCRQDLGYKGNGVNCYCKQSYHF